MIEYFRVNKLLRYNADTGIFTWRISKGTVRAGDAAGCINRYGYIQIKIDGITYNAHRLAWLITTGNWPKDEIDHKNGVRDDNKFINLREATQSRNQQNQRIAHKNNKTGFLGVRKCGKVFSAEIRINGSKRYLGTFPTPELAYSKYVEAKRQFHFGCTI